MTFAELAIRVGGGSSGGGLAAEVANSALITPIAAAMLEAPPPLQRAHTPAAAVAAATAAAGGAASASADAPVAAERFVGWGAFHSRIASPSPVPAAEEAGKEDGEEQENAGGGGGGAMIAVEKVPLQPLTEHRREQRQKQIDLGKGTPEYAAFIAAIPRASRTKDHPAVRCKLPV